MTRDLEILRGAVAALQERVERSERRSRGIAAAAVLAGFVSLALVAARPGAAERGTFRLPAPLVVTGRDGRVLLRIGESADGGTLTVNDRQGTPIARIGTTPDLRGIATFDANGMIAASSGVSRSIVTGAPVRGQRSYDSAGRAGLGMQVVLREGGFEARSMSAFDSEGNRIIEIGNHAGGFLGFSANPGTGAPPMQAGIAADGTPTVSLRGPGGVTMAATRANADSGEISLFNSDGGLVFHAP